jgi:hypothetical protein
MSQHVAAFAFDFKIRSAMQLSAELAAGAG